MLSWISIHLKPPYPALFWWFLQPALLCTKLIASSWSALLFTALCCCLFPFDPVWPRIERASPPSGPAMRGTQRWRLTALWTTWLRPWTWSSSRGDTECKAADSQEPNLLNTSARWNTVIIGLHCLSFQSVMTQTWLIQAVCSLQNI